MTQYRIVKRTNKYSLETFIIQHYSWFKWRNTLMDKYANKIASYRSLIEAKKQLEMLCFIPPEDVVVYRHWK